MSKVITLPMLMDDLNTYLMSLLMMDQNIEY